MRFSWRSLRFFARSASRLHGSGSGGEKEKEKGKGNEVFLAVFAVLSALCVQASWEQEWRRERESEREKRKGMRFSWRSLRFFARSASRLHGSRSGEEKEKRERERERESVRGRE